MMVELLDLIVHKPVHRARLFQPENNEVAAQRLRQMASACSHNPFTVGIDELFTTFRLVSDQTNLDSVRPGFSATTGAADCCCDHC